jgi:hypothetical protein
MTVNENFEAITKASEHWIDAYCTGGNVDLDSFENYSNQFLDQVNKPNITPGDLIGTLCMNTFSGIAFSSLVKYRIDDGDTAEFEEVPVVSMVLYPFKASKSITFGDKEVLFGVVVNEENPKRDVKPIEFVKPMEIFKAWPGDSSSTTGGTNQGPTARAGNQSTRDIEETEESSDTGANQTGTGI